MKTSAVLLALAIWVTLIAACRAPTPERPLEGAQTGPHGQPARPTDSGPPPTLSPPTPSPSPAAPGALAPGASQSPSPSPLAVGGYVIVATDGAGVNMRTGPSASAPVITTVREGTPVEVIGDPVNAEGRAWRQIRANGRDGWVVAVTVRQR